LLNNCQAMHRLNQPSHHQLRHSCKAHITDGSRRLYHKQWQKEKRVIADIF